MATEVSTAIEEDEARIEENDESEVGVAIIITLVAGMLLETIIVGDVDVRIGSDDGGTDEVDTVLNVDIDTVGTETTTDDSPVNEAGGVLRVGRA